jgi:hypothetical protein
MSSSHLRLGLPSGIFPSGFPTKILYAFLVSPCIKYLREFEMWKYYAQSFYRKVFREELGRVHNIWANTISVHHRGADVQYNDANLEQNAAAEVCCCAPPCRYVMCI